MGKYDDIINLPHHVSKNHPRMSNTNRAAQFAPFAALVGFSDAIKNSEEVLEKRIILSEERKEEISTTLHEINAHCRDFEQVEIVYFVLKDKKKDLGKYLSYKGKIKTIDLIEGKMIFINRKSIYLKDIYRIKVINE